ncbi:DUF6674 family protein [Acetatifactor muris]|uniref:DUF6674 family protein n=1 Tax=Acetatifactor muris TaxID=879566 RepID=UPI0023F4DF0D|nr:DUF6674 family protein [Acetatifactor muris]
MRPITSSITGNEKLTKDQIIKELIELLNQNQQKSAANNVLEMTAYIDNMEQKINAVLEELVSVRKQLAEIENRQERKTIKATLTSAVQKLEQQCRKMKQQIFIVKEEVRGKAAEIVAAVRQKGKIALSKVSEFLGVKDKLQNICRNAQNSIMEVDKCIKKIDAFGIGIREAGHKITNSFRAFMDKPEKEYGKKKFSKTDFIKKPFYAKRKLLFGILDYANAAMNKIEQLAEEVKQYRPDRKEYESKDIEAEEQVMPTFLGVAEPDFQYGAEIFEEYQRGMTEETEICKKSNIEEKDMQQKGLQR